jgi:hypothetical protein
MGLRRAVHFAAALALALAFVVSLGCGGGASENPPASEKAAAPAGTAVTPPSPSADVETVPAYTYPAPVKGHFQEVNTGDFDLVDGIASKTVDGTVVFVVAKPIASPVIASAPCPMTLARSLMFLRNAGWVELTLDEKGRSKYYAEGTPFGGSGREEDMGSHPWKSSAKVGDGRASGSVEHRHDGTFKFDLPLSSPQGNEPMESGFSDKKRGDPGAARPDEAAIAAAYDALHKAASAKDLKGFLEAQGFDAKQVAAIRGLDGIQTDFAAFADRFLTPGQGGEGSRGPGWASLRAEGVNSRSAKFVNYYWFTACGDKLVLTRISVNPQ